MEREILVLGASSLVGRNVVDELRHRGFAVCAVSRGAGTGDRSGVRWVRADVTDPEACRGLPPLSTAVSTLPIWLTADIAPTLHERGVERLVAFSSSSATTKAAAADAGERALAARLLDGEKRVRALAPGLSTTILRPTMIYGGPGDANVERIAHLVRRFRVFPLFAGTTGRRQPVHAADLGAAAVDALLGDRTRERVYTVAGGEAVTVRELVSRVAETNGARVRFVVLPPRPVEWTARQLTRLPRVRSIPAGAFARLSEDLVFDNSAATEDFGYLPRRFEPPDYAAAP